LPPPKMKIRQPDSGNPTVRDERGLAETWADGWKKSNRHVIVACNEAFNGSQLLRYPTGGRSRRISIRRGRGG
ncbi:MAG: hypothetical protein U9N19_06325, partial [Thermodesulfobacteriota bacterium]|nr:hypothetical protein [Thermodesulfobacteriota bacterium]